MKKLLLHIGMPKTGTSSLQEFLATNNEALKSVGWIYLDLSKEWKSITGRDSRRGAVNGCALLESIYGLCTDEQKALLWERIYNYLNKYNVIISEEVIWSEPVLSTDVIVKEIKERYDNLKVVVYLRRQDCYVEQLWKQMVKEYLDYSTLHDTVVTAMENNSLNYFSRLEKISDIVGRNNIIVRLYDKNEFQGDAKDINSDFLSSVLKVRKKKSFEYPERQNLSLEGKWLELKWLFNKYFCEAGGKESAIISEYFVKYAYMYGSGEKASVMSKEDFDSIQNLCSESNRMLAKKYLKRDELFNTSEIIKEYEWGEFTESEKNIVCMFANMIAEMCKLNDK